jgi:hypothetical protein
MQLSTSGNTPKALKDRLRVDRPSKLRSSALNEEILLKLMSKNLRIPICAQA